MKFIEVLIFDMHFHKINSLVSLTHLYIYIYMYIRIYIHIYIYIEPFDFSGPHCQFDRGFSVRRVYSSPAALCMLK